jgi:hypothetical protein
MFLRNVNIQNFAFHFQTPLYDLDPAEPTPFGHIEGSTLGAFRYWTAAPFGRLGD